MSYKLVAFMVTTVISKFKNSYCMHMTSHNYVRFNSIPWRSNYKQEILVLCFQLVICKYVETFFWNYPQMGVFKIVKLSSCFTFWKLILRGKSYWKKTDFFIFVLLLCECLWCQREICVDFEHLEMKLYFQKFHWVWSNFPLKLKKSIN